MPTTPYSKLVVPGAREVERQPVEMAAPGTRRAQIDAKPVVDA
jgi:hypothetical protein